MKAMIVFAAALTLCAANATEWVNIDEANWLGGAKITSPAKLQNRVVLVDRWANWCGPCRAGLPRVQEIWQNFGLPANKPLVVIGSHVSHGMDKAKVDKIISQNGITYPVYLDAHIEGEPKFSGIPFIYVLNHRGKIVYSGHSDRDALEAVVNALGEVGVPPSLTRGVKFQKFASLEKQIVLGKPIKSVRSKLKSAAKGKDDVAAAEAESILAAIEKGIAATKEEIGYQKTASPKDAVKLIKLLQTTSPEDAAEYKAGFAALVASAKEQIAEEKASAKKAKK